MPTDPAPSAGRTGSFGDAASRGQRRSAPRRGRRTRAFVAVVLLGLALVLMLSMADHGPSEADRAAQKAALEPGVEWAIDGKPFASYPSVGDEEKAVYLTRDTLVYTAAGAHPAHVTALNARTGRKLWKKSFGEGTGISGAQLALLGETKGLLWLTDEADFSEKTYGLAQPTGKPIVDADVPLSQVVGRLGASNTHSVYSLPSMQKVASYQDDAISLTRGGVADTYYSSYGSGGVRLRTFKGRPRWRHSLASVKDVPT